MTALARKLRAAAATPAWQLALDKFPLNLEREETPSLSFLDERDNEQAVKPRRLGEIAASYAAARSELNVFAERQQRFLAQLAVQHGDRLRILGMVNASRLLLHIGRASVLENVGLYCERVSGLPVIPGPAVKGVISTWACWEGNERLRTEATGDLLELTEHRGTLGENVRKILGDNSSTGSDRAGGIVFLGGYPVSPPVLELDIVTPHPLEGRGRITPNPFLALKEGTLWTFAFLATSRVDEGEVATLIDETERLLTDCLTQTGMGAKTAAGYGIFRRLNDTEGQRENQRIDSLKKEIAKKGLLRTLPPEEQAYIAFVSSITEWAPVARDIAQRDKKEAAWILRFFRSEEGQAIIKGWPKNQKAKARLDALKQAGLYET